MNLEPALEFPLLLFSLLLLKLTTYDIRFHDGAQNLDFLAVENGVANNFLIVIEDVLEIPPVNCDLLFIDTLHNYNQIRQELKFQNIKTVLKR